MFIKNFQRIKYSTKTKYQSGHYDACGVIFKSLTGIDKLFRISIEKNEGDIFWSIFEEVTHPSYPSKKFVAKFLKLNEVRAFLQNKYSVAYQ